MKTPHKPKRWCITFRIRLFTIHNIKLTQQNKAPFIVIMKAMVITMTMTTIGAIKYNNDNDDNKISDNDNDTNNDNDKDNNNDIINNDNYNNSDKGN